MFTASDQSGRNAGGGGTDQVPALLIKYRTQLYAYLLAVLGDANDAEDLLQDVSLAVIQNAGKCVPNTNFRAWVYEFCRFQILAKAKVRSRRGLELLSPEVLAHLELADQESDDGVSLDARRTALLECLKALPGFQRKAIDLRYASGFDVPRVAKLLGKTLQTTYTVLKRARQALRECTQRRLAKESAKP
ncbi:MAG: sigma-70 family RNA polymerase sigma factor [Planctomycetes bacterium]|nr:sigma-70 family RNA polymerase sigma factor [Planctomycetota bacterium]